MRLLCQLVLLHLPLKQGLKQWQNVKDDTDVIFVLLHLPLKQGLKQASQTEISFRVGEVLLHLPLKQGLKLKRTITFKCKDGLFFYIFH